MTEGQRRILYDLALGRELREDRYNPGSFVWGDERKKPPLDKKVVDTLISNGVIVKDFKEWLVLTTLGKEMLEKDSGRS